VIFFFIRRWRHTMLLGFFFFSSRRRHTRLQGDWSSDVCSSDLIDTIPAIALPYVASAFGIFLLRQTFKTVPKELDDAARVEGASPLQVLLKIYVPLARPIYVAYGLVSVSYHWNNFLWPLIVT